MESGSLRACVLSVEDPAEWQGRRRKEDECI